MAATLLKAATVSCFDTEWLSATLGAQKGTVDLLCVTRGLLLELHSRECLWPGQAGPDTGHTNLGRSIITTTSQVLPDTNILPVLRHDPQRFNPQNSIRIRSYRV